MKLYQFTSSLGLYVRLSDVMFGMWRVLGEERGSKKTWHLLMFVFGISQRVTYNNARFMGCFNYVVKF